MATSTLRRRNGPGLLVIATLGLLLTSCGQASTPELESRALRPPQQSEYEETSDPQAGEAGAQLSESELLEAESAAAAASAAAQSSGRQRVAQGAAAVDPRALGTIVAHAISSEIVAYEEPNLDSPVVESFENPTERSGPLVFAGVGRPTDGWLEVLLPIRPNGTTGWIQAAGVDLSINPYRIEIDASAYQLTIFRYGRQQLATTVAIGNGDTPTPIGEFFLIELLRPSNPDGAYGPYAYGLSGYSETLETFNGGEGIIGIHGTNQPELLGQDVSHGCIRVANPTISEMTEFLPLGTPVIIFRSDEPLDDADA